MAIAPLPQDQTLLICIHAASRRRPQAKAPPRAPPPRLVGRQPEPNPGVRVAMPPPCSALVDEQHQQGDNRSRPGPPLNREQSPSSPRTRPDPTFPGPPRRRELAPSPSSSSARERARCASAHPRGTTGRWITPAPVPDHLRSVRAPPAVLVVKRLLHLEPHPAPWLHLPQQPVAAATIMALGLVQLRGQCRRLELLRWSPLRLVRVAGAPPSPLSRCQVPRMRPPAPPVSSASKQLQRRTSVSIPVSLAR
ncbi:hypothetical protein TRIUR3_33567 [Triticum urartu]|uniref:Uncharacterized protein n=1 Tax=Triticum urartu TaxID=4572 RepID=M7ZXL4_TRIUA|nr:hypothetical protein TRIUR3_33567 [Triticum urartu]